MTVENSTISKDRLWEVYSQVSKAFLVLDELANLTPIDSWNYNLLQAVSSQQLIAFNNLTSLFSDLDSLVSSLAVDAEQLSS